MKSINFEILRDSWPELADLGGFAEQYAYPDPPSALVKLRSYVEYMVLGIYRGLNISKPFQANLFDLMNHHDFNSKIPKPVLDKFHAIRVNGNKAAHGDSSAATNRNALWLLREAHDLARWFYISYCNGKLEDCTQYQEPSQPEAAEKEKNGLRRAVLNKMAAQEARMEQLLVELEHTRSHAQVAEKKAEELEALVSASHKTANVLDFDEATTRKRLIDSMLAAAGWDIGPDGKDTEEVTQEEKVEHQPTDTGIGYADYVLWDDNGKPLAVIEAKKTSTSAEVGKEQARLYADGLEKMHGQRPVVFYTNGYDINIWDDAQGYPSRKIYGYYSKASLQYLVNFQRNHKKDLDSVEIKPEITDRLYQLEAIKRVNERFKGKYRKALLVQATGTGKTRVAISLADVLLRANWVKCILFLCDRRELRKQAKNVFNDFIDEPITVITGKTSKDRDKRIYLATYPAMSKVFQSFDVGYFDLIIADESHRSIYNRYREMFTYFDCLQVGLTATPVEMLARNTFRMFDCEEGHPTAFYSLEKAVEEGHLAHYEVYTHTTNFLRKGIHYKDLTEEQKQQLEENGEDSEDIDYDRTQVDKQIFNKDTNRAIIRNLMDNGIRDAIDQNPGKTIIFARNHNHAILLEKLFNEMYPQYGGEFCKVIDNYDPRAEQLIDDFKNNEKNLTIAISVDMLDTGIDVPEIVNLVFAKPVYSRVKFDQMIGRGTRLCPGLFGEGKNKKNFRIFDHWGNFDFFEKEYKEAEALSGKSLMQRLFETRIDLAETSLRKPELFTFRMAVDLIEKDINSLPDDTIAVREKWREKRTVQKQDVLHAFAPATVALLRDEIAPLMQWREIRGFVEAHNFDHLIAQMQLEWIRESGGFDDLKDNLLNAVNELPMHLNPVREKEDAIRKLESTEF